MREVDLVAEVSEGCDGDATDRVSGQRSDTDEPGHQLVAKGLFAPVRITRPLPGGGSFDGDSRYSLFLQCCAQLVVLVCGSSSDK